MNGKMESMEVTSRGDIRMNKVDNLKVDPSNNSKELDHSILNTAPKISFYGNN